MELGLKMNMWSKNKADSGKMWLKRLNLTPNMIVKKKNGHLYINWTVIFASKVFLTTFHCIISMEKNCCCFINSFT